MLLCVLYLYFPFFLRLYVIIVYLWAYTLSFLYRMASLLLSGVGKIQRLYIFCWQWLSAISRLPRYLKMGRSFTPWSPWPGEAVGCKPTLLCRRFWLLLRNANKSKYSKKVCSSQFNTWDASDSLALRIPDFWTGSTVSDLASLCSRVVPVLQFFRVWHTTLYHMTLVLSH